jgi:hypothetical protein
MGRGDSILFVHPSPSQRLSEPAATLAAPSLKLWSVSTLPHQRGRGIDGKNFKYLWIE